MRIRERFNPRAPCGARRHGCRYGQPDRTISTHAPLAGRDIPALISVTEKLRFQPTRPLRGATGSRRHAASSATISTHAPLAGRDESGKIISFALLNFNPRAPCGARPLSSLLLLHGLNFNPRAPCGARLEEPEEEP